MRTRLYKTAKNQRDIGTIMEWGVKVGLNLQIHRTISCVLDDIHVWLVVRKS